MEMEAGWKGIRRCSAVGKPRMADLVVIALRRIAIGLLLFAPAIGLSSQESAPAQNAAQASDSPFAGLNDSLERTADGALAAAGRVGPTASESREANILTASRADHDGTPLRPLRTGSALSRLAFLRPLINPILQQSGVPTELSAVVMVESGGDPMALSQKGARGIWQLMPATARRYGLVVNDTEDDRLDIEKSTHAAAHYLGDLYAEFGSWPLALAAYNTGEQNLQFAISRSRSTNFGVLSSGGFLPLETRNYVPAVFAAVTRLNSYADALAIGTPWKPRSGTVFAVAEGGN